MSFGTSFGIEETYEGTNGGSSFLGGGNTLMTILIVVFAVILVGVIGRALYIWMKNNRSPQETVEARVVAKRMKVSGHGGSAIARNTSTMNTFHSSTYTNYFVTFELEGGKRLELGVKDPEYGMLAEGDHGRLSYQGTRYLGFERM